MFFIREAIILIASFIGMVTDLKTGLIYDKLTLPIIVIGIVLNLVGLFFGLISLDLVSYFGLGGLIFVFGWLLYRTGKLGGGDVKLFLGIHFVLPMVNGFPTIILVLIFSALSSIIVLSVYYLVKLLRKGINLKQNYSSLKKAFIFGIGFVVYFWFMFSRNVFPTEFLLLFAFPLFFGLIFVALEKQIREEFFLKKVKLSQLEEDEIIAFDYFDEKLKKELNLKEKRVLGKTEIEKLIELKVKTIPVYRDLPKFGPFIFVGVLLTTVLADFLEFLWIFA
ncbi:MAG: A24 family peptidase [archaeon]